MPETFTVIVIVLIIIFFIARRSTNKEAKQYAEENSEIREAQKIENVDSLTEIIVDFVYLRKQYNDLMNSFPNITIDKIEKYKMLNDKISLKLSPKFNLHFGIPYMRGEAFKIDLSYNLQAGKRYRLTFKPPAFVFSKPKVNIEELRNI
jgi:hypothetical protein